MSDQEDMSEFNSIVSKGGSRSNKVATQRGESPAPDEPDRAHVNAKMWAMYGDKNFSACEQAVDEIPPGQYTIKTSQQLGIFFQKVDINLDDLIKLPDSVSEEVIREIETFWTKEEHFRNLGFLWKRGILAWGPPGSGKTSCLQQVSAGVVASGGISVYIENPSLAAAGLKILRNIEPLRPILVMLEDIDAIIDRHGEADLLALMDGETQIDNVVFVATTNYPERLDNRFVNRPSRFDLVKKIGMPNPESRELFLKTKNKRLALPENDEELGNWVALTEHFSVAHMKELIVSVEVFGVEVDSAVRRLKTMMDVKLSSSSKEKGPGFLG